MNTLEQSLNKSMNWEGKCRKIHKYSAAASMVETDACKMEDMCCAIPDADGIRGLAKGLTKHPLSLKRGV